MPIYVAIYVRKVPLYQSLFAVILFSCVSQQCHQQSMTHSGSGQADVDGALDSGQSRGCLTCFDSGIPPPISFVAFGGSESDWVDVGRLRERPDHMERLG